MRRLRWAVALGLSFAGGVGLFVGCSAGADDGSGSGPGGTSTGTNGQGGAGAGNGQGGEGNTFVTTGPDAPPDTPVNPCGTGCGDEEICDGAGKGFDDDCDGTVDEGCPCSPGEASSCFKGDSSYRDDPGCNAGTMRCLEALSWGPCEGGNHATAEEQCFNASPTNCGPINAVPFQTTDLFSGTGTFDDDADANSSVFEVECPAGVTPCPAVGGVSDYQALQSGEYTVTYTKTVDGNPETCTFPLYIGAPGLRVELSWNWGDGVADLADVDLDLHMHQPGTVEAWSMSGGDQADCGFGNCRANDFDPPPDSTAPQWFPTSNQPPDPVNWYDNPNDQLDTCYYAPRGAGEDWSDIGLGCHSPRLDLDNTGCTPSVTDPQSTSFCAPENINVDFPPSSQWTRIAVHMWDLNSGTGTVTPTLKIYCDGALSAELGPTGFAAPVTFSAPGDDEAVWLAADVIFPQDQCAVGCFVRNLYADQNAQTPYITTRSQAENDAGGFGPAYAPIPTQ